MLNEYRFRRGPTVEVHGLFEKRGCIELGNLVMAENPSHGWTRVGVDVGWVP